MRIQRTRLEIENPTVVSLPEDHELLDVAVSEDGNLYLYYLTSSKNKKLFDYELYIYEVDEEIPASQTYILSFKQGAFVWHLYS